MLGTISTYEFTKTPSQVLNIKCEYTAYCLDECCAYIIRELNDGKKILDKKDKTKEIKNYSRPSDLYSQIR